MSIWAKIKKAIAPPPSGDPFIEYHIKCDHCGDIVTVRVFPNRDLNATYADSGPAYTLIKEVMDNKCFRLLTLTAEYSASKEELRRDITGGTFVDSLPPTQDS